MAFAIQERTIQNLMDIVDEIIIVDTGSTDKTKQIAYDFTDKVLDFEWIDDFSAARNFAFSQATKDYVFWLDADDLLSEEDQEKFKQLKAELTYDVDTVSMIYHIAFDEYDNPTFSYRRNRLVKRELNFNWKGVVHEYLEFGGHVISSDIAIRHRKKDKKKTNRQSDRNLKIYEKNGLMKIYHFL